MNVLYITYDGLTDPLGQSQVLPYLCFLAGKGYRFTILSFEKKARMNKEANIIRGIVDKVGIKWVPLSFTSSPPLISKAWDRWRMRLTALALHREQQFGLVHCRSYVAAEVGLALKHRFGIKMLFDMRGFWADEKVDNGQWNQQCWVYRKLYQFFKKKEQDFLLDADGIVSLTQAAKDYLLTVPAYRHLAITVIPCCADLAHFDFGKINQVCLLDLRLNLGLSPNEKVLTYLGSIGGWYMTKEMFLLFKMLKQQHTEYRMLILTKDDPEKVKAEAAFLGIATRDIIVRYVPRADLPAYLAVSTLSVFFIRNSYSKIASSPTKHAELMGMGLPVICNPVGDTGQIVEASKTGLLLKEFSEIGFANVINKIPALEKVCKAHIRNAAVHYFALEKGTAAYHKLYLQLME